MSNLRNRKRLASVLVALMLTFVVGAAFAFDAGVLTVGGTLAFSFEPDHAIWAEGGETGQVLGTASIGGSAVTTAEAPSYVATAVLAGATLPVVNDGDGLDLVAARDRDQQHLPVHIEFEEPGQVVFTLRPVNRCPINAATLVAGIYVLNAADSVWTDLELTAPEPGYSGWIATLAGGVTLTMSASASQVIPEATSTTNIGIGAPVTVTVAWDGTGMPGDFNIDDDASATPPIYSDNPAVSFLIAIDYTATAGVRP